MASQSAAKGRAKCQVHGCDYKLTCTDSGFYYYRKRICPPHMQASVVKCAAKGGAVRSYRFCQQCGRMQPLNCFQGDKRSCQYSLNRRRAHMRSVTAAAQSKSAAACRKVSSSTGTKKSSKRTSSRSTPEAVCEAPSSSPQASKDAPRSGASSTSEHDSQHLDADKAGVVLRRSRRSHSRRYHPYDDDAGADDVPWMPKAVARDCGRPVDAACPAADAGCGNAAEQTALKDICSPRESIDSTARIAAEAAQEQGPVQGSVGLMHHPGQQQPAGGQHLWLCAQPNLAQSAAVGLGPDQGGCPTHHEMQELYQWQLGPAAPAGTGIAASWQHQQLIPVQQASEVPVVRFDAATAAAAVARVLKFPGDSHFSVPHCMSGPTVGHAQAGVSSGPFQAPGSSQASLEAHLLSGSWLPGQQTSSMMASQAQPAATADQLPEFNIHKQASCMSASQGHTLAMSAATAAGSRQLAGSGPRALCSAPPVCAGAAGNTSGATSAECCQPQRGKGNMSELLNSLLAEMETEGAEEEQAEADLAQLIEAELQQAVAAERAKLHKLRELQRLQQLRSRMQWLPLQHQQRQVLNQAGNQYGGSSSFGTDFHSACCSGPAAPGPMSSMQEHQLQHSMSAATGIAASGGPAQALAEWFTAPGGSSSQPPYTAALAGTVPRAEQPYPAAMAAAAAGAAAAVPGLSADRSMPLVEEGCMPGLLQQQLHDPNLIQNMHALKQYLNYLPHQVPAKGVMSPGMQLAQLGQQLAACVDQLKGLLSEVGVTDVGSIIGELGSTLQFK